MTEPVIAYGLQGQVALADVLVLPAMEEGCGELFARWPGLTMVVFRRRDGCSTITTRGGMQLTVSAKSTQDTIRCVYVWWSLTRQRM